MMLYSPTLARSGGVVAGFTTRRGGVSAGPLRSLNLARRPGETPQALAENWRRVGMALGVEGASVALCSQVHGDAVLDASAVGPGITSVGAADALICTRPGVLVAVRVADCVPILMAAPGAVAAVHAGWRGTAARIATKALAQLCAAAGCAPAAVVASIGPCIGPERYEVGDEVVEAMCALVPREVAVLEREPRCHVDLQAVNRALLADAGVGQVEILRRCTASEPDHFYSHRRDGAATGRQAGVIGLCV
ncbi:MAG: peptidoglycan editing factor PgeF [Alphaproteobacteria bacterium]|nr:peptidoglycan editing factor PgeF [Alphaproteobacteria bacterium]